MKSRVIVQVSDLRLEAQEWPIPRVGRDEGLLRIEACGLCGSDVEQYRGNFVTKGLVRYPLIPGHEPVGVIEEIGSEAARRWKVKVGDRVALEPHLSCGLCARCLGGEYHLCKSVQPVGLPCYGYLPLDFGHGLWGGYSQYIHLHPRTVLHRIPPEMPLQLAALYQCIAAGVRWSVQVPKTALGDRVLVLGCGQRGLGSVVACREAGAGTIIVTGLSRDRYKLDLALSLGATHTIDVDREDTVARVMELTDGEGVDVAIDVVPSAQHPVLHAVDVVRTGGTIVLAGVKGKDTSVALDTDKIVFNEITLRGVYSQGWDAYEEALRLLTQNKYRLERLHTHEFCLEQAEEAILTLAGQRGGDAISVSLHP